MVPYRKIFEELEKRKIRYLLAGGLAVNFHKVQRITVDLDLIIHLQPKNILAFVKMMLRLGYQPRVPVNPVDFANPKIRKEWISKKGMLVFSFVHPSNPFELVDIFVKEPRPFKDLWRRRLKVTVTDATIQVVGKKDLMYMKKIAGRPKDLFDLEELKKQKD
ncbi:MAG: nucleotidyl transferase AbiEii/AbiGii toxin family protein [Deltaproteobacteria bacterium]|nr:nucleotidyl transferase AbiEii/AbiGii toxin family protein [Deltaproteobacteria bacterium]